MSRRPFTEWSRDARTEGRDSGSNPDSRSDVPNTEQPLPISSGVASGSGPLDRDGDIESLLRKNEAAEQTIETALDLMREPCTLEDARRGRHVLVEHYNAIRKQAVLEGRGVRT